MSDGGWIKLHRKILKNPIVMKDNDHLAVWIYLLLSATHEPIPSIFGGKKIILQAGQLVTGRKKISATLNVQESKVRRILNELESDQQIDRQSSNQNTLITILNWDLYQCCGQQNDQRMTNERPTDDQQMTNERPTSDHIQEVNKLRTEEQKNIRSVFIPPSVDEVRLYILEKGYPVNAEAFVDYYQSVGWMVGNKKMKDWKSAVRTWARKEKPKPTSSGSNGNASESRAGQMALYAMQLREMESLNVIDGDEAPFEN